MNNCEKCKSLPDHLIAVPREKLEAIQGILRMAKKDIIRLNSELSDAKIEINILKAQKEKFNKNNGTYHKYGPWMIPENLFR